MFLRNSWYVVAWSRDLGADPLALTVLGERLVIFRTQSGVATILEDHCPHRHAPLSIGKVQGETIQCGYHGLTFDGTGKCVHAPSQSEAPPRARVRAYPTVERYGWVWAWMGEPAAADPMSIPDFSLLTSPDHKAVGKTNHVRASYKLLNDNLLDLSHVGYVHQSTIGNPEMTEKGSLSVKRQPHGVQVRRVVPDVPPPPTYVKTGVLPEGRRIDRWQVIEFTAPCFVRIHVGGAEAGTGALDGVYEHGLNLWIMNAMTPETPHSTHYFWASVRAHALEDPAADHLLFSQIGDAFEEDARVLEAQQLVLLDRADDWNLALQSDAGSIQARRMLDRLIAEEQATSATAAATVAAR